MYNLYHEAVERGYRLLAWEPLFLVNERDDFLRGEFVPGTEGSIICCISLDPAHAPKNAIVYPPCRVFPACAAGITLISQNSSTPLAKKGPSFGRIGILKRDLIQLRVFDLSQHPKGGLSCQGRRGLVGRPGLPGTDGTAAPLLAGPTVAAGFPHKAKRALPPHGPARPRPHLLRRQRPV